METVSAERAVSPTWRISVDVTLESHPTQKGETERWETTSFGPHPIHVLLVKYDNGQWGASLGYRGFAYEYSALGALTAARGKALDSLDWEASRVAAAGFEWVDR